MTKQSVCLGVIKILIYGSPLHIKLVLVSELCSPRSVRKWTLNWILTSSTCDCSSKVSHITGDSASSSRPEYNITGFCAPTGRSLERQSQTTRPAIRSCVGIYEPPSATDREQHIDTFCSGNESASRCDCSRGWRSTGWGWTSRSPQPGCCPASDAAFGAPPPCWCRCSNSHISNSGNGSNFSDWHLKT